METRIIEGELKALLAMTEVDDINQLLKLAKEETYASFTDAQNLLYKQLQQTPSHGVLHERY